MFTRKYEKAKEIFMKYQGNHYGMDLDGEYELYKSYGVPRRIERKWLAELKEICISRLNSETNEKKYIKKFRDAIEVLNRLEDIDGLIDLLINTSQRAKQMTTIPLVLWAEDLIRTAVCIEDAKFLAKTKEFVIPILEDALSKPLLLSEEFLLLRRSVFTEENITVKRPGNGISPMLWDEVIGRTATRDFAYDTLIVID